MPSQIPGTPQNAAEQEAMILKHMDVETAQDRQAEFANAERAYRIAAERRNAAVAALCRHGWLQRDVAERLGISLGRVGHIVSNARRAAEAEEASS